MIDKQNPKYAEIVQVSIDKKHYTINTNLLEAGESIVCPTDESMIVVKESSGDCKIVKRSVVEPDFLK